jgi:hypothetical protein
MTGRRGRRQVTLLAALLVAGCGSDPEDTYLRLCLAASTVELQRASCRCMSEQYAAVLEPEEFDAVAVMMEKAAGASSPVAAGLSMGTFVEPSPNAAEVLMRAFGKMDRLHRAGVCGYGVQAPAPEVPGTAEAEGLDVFTDGGEAPRP